MGYELEVLMVVSLLGSDQSVPILTFVSKLKESI